MRRAATRPAMSGAFRHRRGNGRMPRKAQVVVTREVDELSAIDQGSYTTPRLDESVNRSPRPPKMLTIELREGGLQLRRPALHLRSRAETPAAQPRRQRGRPDLPPSTPAA